MKNFILVFLGGGLGSGLRYLISLFFNLKSNGFPVGTLLVNILGSLLIGILLAFFSKYDQLPAEYKLLSIAGFCGGFTTMSAFSAESIQLLKEGNYLYFSLYVGLSISLCLLCTFSGFKFFS